MASLGAAFVVSVASVFVATLFTRSPYFGTALWAALWLIVFAPTYFYSLVAVNVYAYTAGGVFLAAILGALLCKLLAQGQLVNVWLTGSGGGLNAHGEERNVPYIVFATIALFFTTFFFVAGATNDNPSATPPAPSFMTGTVAIGDPVALVAASALLIATLALLFISAYPREYGDRLHELPDQMSAIYYVSMAIAIVAPAIVVLSSFSTPIRRGIVAMLVAFVVDALIFIGGYWYERQRYASAAKADRWHGRLYRVGSSVTATALPLVLFALLHGLIFLFGGFAIAANGNNTQALFAFPWFALAFVIAIGIVFVCYAIIAACFPSVYVVRAWGSSPPPPEEQEPLVEATAVAQGRARRREPVTNDDASTSGDFDI